MKIYYLGPQGTFTEIAARELGLSLENPDLEPIKPASEVAKKVDADKGHYGVLPINNRINGLVQFHLDAIYKNNLRIIGAHRLPLVFGAGVHPESKGEDRIRTHIQAYHQCSQWLTSHYPDAMHTDENISTAEGADIVAKEQRGIAIAHPETLSKRGLTVLAENIDNLALQGIQNYTDFLLLTDDPDHVIDYDPAKQYNSLIAVVPHQDMPGLLHELTGAFIDNNIQKCINLSEIHTRPALYRDGREIQDDGKMFYIEVEAHCNSPQMERAVDSLDKMLKRDDPDVDHLRIIGSYERLPTIK